MPIYEYQCKKCNARFEELQRMNEKANCPKCGSSSVERLLSTFAPLTVLSNMPKCEGSTPTCAPSKCASGVCGMQKR